MKKLVILSVIASLALADNSVTTLTIDQTNEIYNNTDISNGATVSQGQTDIKNGSNVENVTITQTDNTIDNSQISGTDSEIYQGLTSVDSSRLENATLDSTNSIKDITVTGGKSTITQGNLIIGGDSNVTGTASSGSNHGGSGENIKITETNTLEDTDIQNSTIDQGLTKVNNGAVVSSTFNLQQTNNINRVTTFGDNDGKTNDINGTITQGLTTISGGSTSNIDQNIQNNISYMQIDGTTVNQSSINLINSTVENINNTNSSSTIDEINRIEHVTGNGETSSIIQSNITAENSTIDNLQRSGTVSAYGEDTTNWIDKLTLTDSNIKQSTFVANGTMGSTVQNITYGIVNTDNREAINDIYSVTALTNSNLQQDVTEIENSTFKDSQVNRVNLMANLTASNSDIAQSKLSITNSTANQLQLSNDNTIGDWESSNSVSTTNAVLEQGSTIITD